MTGDGQRWNKVLCSVAVSLGLVQCGPVYEPTGVVGVEALVRSGLIGHWAINCDVEFTEKNPHLIYAVPEKGDPTEKLLMDALRNRTTPLRDIRELKGGMIEWTQPLHEGSVKVVTRISKGRQKTWSSTLPTGTIVIDQGQYDGGGEVPWFNRCSEG